MVLAEQEMNRQESGAMLDSKAEVTPDQEQKSGLPSEEKHASHSGDHYEIVVKGQLEAHWAERLGDLDIVHDDHGNSHLTGVVPDQAALHGILAQIRDLGLTLISLSPQPVRVEESQSAEEQLNEKPA